MKKFFKLILYIFIILLIISTIFLYITENEYKQKQNEANILFNSGNYVQSKYLISELQKGKITNENIYNLANIFGREKQYLEAIHLYTILNEKCSIGEINNKLCSDILYNYSFFKYKSIEGSENIDFNEIIILLEKSLEYNYNKKAIEALIFISKESKVCEEKKEEEDKGEDKKDENEQKEKPGQNQGSLNDNQKNQINDYLNYLKKEELNSQKYFNKTEENGDIENFGEQIDKDW